MTGLPQYCRTINLSISQRLSSICPQRQHLNRNLFKFLAAPFFVPDQQTVARSFTTPATCASSDSTDTKTVDSLRHLQSQPIPTVSPLISHLTNPIHSTDGRTYTPLIDILRQRVEEGELVSDAAQVKAAKRLSRLQRALVGYTNEGIIAEVEESIRRKKSEAEANGVNGGDESSNNSEQIDSGTKKGNTAKMELDNLKTTTTGKTENRIPLSKSTPVPRGLFLYGDVGTGKSFLMDVFHASAPIPTSKKRRVHFHSFMQDVHRRIHELKRRDLETDGRNFTIDTTLERNPIYRVATALASEVTLLSFDEFQVTDIADALILSQLFSVLFHRGTVVVATSNRPPSTLYEDGLNRSYFLPFIDLLQSHCIVHDMDATVDYRRIAVLDEGDDFFFVREREPKGSRGGGRRTATICPRYEAAVRTVWADAEVREMTLPIAFQRTLHVREASLPTDDDCDDGDGRPHTAMARFHFDDLCTSYNLGPADFRAIANRFPTVVLEGVPRLTRREHDRARRFITLVDELYEAGCVLMVEAAAHPDELFDDSEDGGDAGRDGVEGVETKVREAFGIDVAQGNGLTVGGMASVKELSFAFRRAASRLTEMCSRPWWERRRRERRVMS